MGRRSKLTAAVLWAVLPFAPARASAERPTMQVDPTEGPCHDRSVDRENVWHPVLHAGLCRGFTANAFLGAVGDARPFATGASLRERLGGGGELGVSVTYSGSARFAVGPLLSARVSSDAGAAHDDGVPHVDAGVRLGVHALFATDVKLRGSYWDLVLAAETHGNEVATCGALYGRVGHDFPIDAGPVRGGVTETWLLLAAWLSAPLVCRAEPTAGGPSARLPELRFGALLALAWRAQ